LTRLLILAIALQFGQRTALTPAETLLEPAILKAIVDAPLDFQKPGPPLIQGADAGAGEIIIISPSGKGITASAGLQKINGLIETKALPRPARSIRFLTSTLNTFETSSLQPPQGAKAAIMVVDDTVPTRQVIRGLWSMASIIDEVLELFARQTSGAMETQPYRNVGQPRWESFGIPVTTILTGENTEPFSEGAVLVASTAYFLATLPNAGSEALLSHLTVGAHARLAEDGRRAVAQMGNQQRASADVLVMFGQAIEREQRRMRSFERFMPEPVDPMLRSRIADMEKGITSVWTSIGITSSPFVPPAERLRGRAGEDRRIPARIKAPMPPVDAPALAKLPHVRDLVYEITNFIDGKRSISDIRDAVTAEFGSVPLPAVVDYVERLAKAGAITLR
jgi:hypothetical protein